MAGERNEGNSGASTTQNPSVQGVNGGAQSQGSDEMLARFAQLESRVVNAEARADAAEKTARQASSKADKVRDQVYDRVVKKMAEKEKVIREVAAEEGWTEEATTARLEASRLKVLTENLTTKELEALKAEDTPKDPEAPHYEGESLQVQSQRTTRPTLDVNGLETHANQLRQWLKANGLEETDLGPSGIAPFVGMTDGSDQQWEFMQKAVEAKSKKKQLAQDLAQQQQREELAEEVSQELQDYGNLGGVSGASGGAAANSTERMIEQEMKKFRGTGDIAGALQARQELQARYGTRR